MTDPLPYDNPLITRYASRQMAELWGPQRKHSTWRRLWLALAEAQHELGLTADDGITPRISADQLIEMRSQLDDIDFKSATQYEMKFRHDVMAHIHAFGDVAPRARAIIHLGATSCFVTDNTDLLLMREGLELIRNQLVGVVNQFAEFAERWKDLPTLGYTHFQPAILTTVGKRACLWCYDFVLDLVEIEHRLSTLALRGAKGTTGTQASFLELFRGDHKKVQKLDHLVAEKMGFAAVYPVTGQTYTRKVDAQILDALSGVAQSAHKFATDLRLLAHEQELEEPFESEQVGSSAMAFKRNPMRAERICSLARFVMGLPAMAAQTAATQWMERTLDDSAGRRLYIPQAFLAVDAICRILLNIINRLELHPAIIAKNIARQLPFLVTENLLMAAVAKGGDRQELHERLRNHTMSAAAQLKEGKDHNELIDLIAADPSFRGIDLAGVLNPQLHVGRAPIQVDEFISQVVEPIRLRFSSELNQPTELHV
jgi:adenylosuccinate lyase